MWQCSGQSSSWCDFCLHKARLNGIPPLTKSTRLPNFCLHQIPECQAVNEFAMGADFILPGIWGRQWRATSIKFSCCWKHEGWWNLATLSLRYLIIHLPPRQSISNDKNDSKLIIQNSKSPPPWVLKLQNHLQEIPLIEGFPFQQYQELLQFGKTRKNVYVFLTIYHSLGEEKVAPNCPVTRILFQLELDNFEIRWSLMLTDLFDSIWGEVLD
jgi:hypothetical protein